jgi:hypothetical protein
MPAYNILYPIPVDAKPATIHIQIANKMGIEKRLKHNPLQNKAKSSSQEYNTRPSHSAPHG